MDMIAGGALGNDTRTVIIAVGILDMRAYAGFDSSIARAACSLAVFFAGLTVEMIAFFACNRNTQTFGRTIHR